VGTKRLNRDDGGRVAGQDDHLGPLCDEVVGQSKGAFENLGVRFVSVGTPSVVADIDDLLLW